MLVPDRGPACVRGVRVSEVSAVENVRGTWGQKVVELPSVAGRVPPHDLEAEAAVLSAVMIDPLSLDKVLEFLKPEHFYSEAHRRIFEACSELKREGKPVDVVQVGTWLKDRERIAQVGGVGYLTEILNAAPAVANVAAYGYTIREKARVRQLIATCQRVAAEGYIDYGEAQSFIDGAEQAVYEIARTPESTTRGASAGRHAAGLHAAAGGRGRGATASPARPRASRSTTS